MKQELLSCCICIFMTLFCHAADSGNTRILVDDEFSSREKFRDISLVAQWGGHTRPMSALELVKKADASGLTYSAVKMSDEAHPHSRWDGDLHASTALDYVDGKKSPYPIGPTQKGGRIASDKEWRHITWKIFPERLELYWRPSKDKPDADHLVFFMDIPIIPQKDDAEAILCKRLAKSHGLTDLKQLPPLYNWFPQAEAVRFYFRGNQTYLANVRITAARYE